MTNLRSELLAIKKRAKKEARDEKAFNKRLVGKFRKVLEKSKKLSIVEKKKLEKVFDSVLRKF